MSLDYSLCPGNLLRNQESWKGGGLVNAYILSLLFCFSTGGRQLLVRLQSPESACKVSQETYLHLPKQ